MSEKRLQRQIKFLRYKNLEALQKELARAEEEHQREEKLRKSPSAFSGWEGSAAKDYATEQAKYRRKYITAVRRRIREAEEAEKSVGVAHGATTAGESRVSTKRKAGRFQGEASKDVYAEAMKLGKAPEGYRWVTHEGKRILVKDRGNKGPLK